MTAADRWIDDETELWLPVVNYEGRYEVSDRGQVRSLGGFFTDKLGRNKVRFGRLLKPSGKPGEYQRVNLGMPQRTHHVHTLVLLAFVGLSPEGTEARHVDGDPQNNALTNLRWGTSLENADDTRRHGTHAMTRLVRCKRGHLLVAPNLREWELTRGKRRCLACRRASQAGLDPKTDEYQRRADELYRQIMEGQPEV